MTADAAARRITFGDVFAVREFRALFASDAASLLGDQIAAVALAVLLYDRSGSALLAALGYSTAFLPWAIGGPLLSTLADRLPARHVLVTCDAARAVLIGLAALPGMPLVGVAVLVLLAGLIAPAFDSAGSSQYPVILGDDLYPMGLSIRSVLHQSATLLGFLAGGALLLVVEPHVALAIDAVTFAVSAVILRLALRLRPAAMADEDGDAGRPRPLRDALEGLRIVASDHRCWGPLTLGVVGSCYVIAPEAIAPAYADALGGSSALVGVIMASVAAGSVVGDVVLARFLSAQARQRSMWPLALLGTVPLLVIGVEPPLAVAVALLAVAGFGSAFQVPANTMFTRAVPPAARGRAFGLAMTGMYGGQGVAILLAGAAAQVVHAPTVIALFAAVGAVGIAALWAVTTRLDRIAPVA